MSSNVFDRFDETEEQGAQQASGNVFDQFDSEASGTRPAEGNVFDRFEAGASQQEAANEATGPLETSRQSVIRPMGSGDINVFGDASGFTQEAIEGWGPVAKSQAFRQGDWQTRQRMRGDYLDSTLRSRLSGPEYSQALEEFMNATGDDVFRPDRLLRSQSLNAGYGGGLADQRALQERRQAQADNSGMGLQLPDQSPPGVTPEETNSSPERAQVEGGSQESGSILTDFGNLLSMGADRAALNTREVVRKTFGEGVVASIDRADEWLNGKESEALLSERIERNESELTTETTEARGKAWWDSEKGTLGPAWSDWRSYFSGITESIPETAMTMAPSMMLSKGVYAWNTARGVAPKLAAKRAATTATLAGGLSEGLLGGAASSREVRDSIRNMPEEQLRESAAIQSLMSEGGLTFEQARNTLAEDASSQAFITSGVITGAFGGMGDRALAGIITGGPTSRLGAALRGAAGEGIFEEMPQEAGQQASENLAMRRADESIGVLDDVPNAALGGLAIGASMGVGMGAAAGGKREASNPEGQPQEAGQPGERRENSSDAEFEQVWREHERENNLEPIDLQQDTGTVIDIAPNADLIRTPRHELSSAEREARDSLAYGNDFKTLRAAAEQKGDADAVAELDAVSEQVSDLLGAEALSRTRGESLDPIRERLNAAADRFTQVAERIRAPQAGTNVPAGLDLPGSGGTREAVEQAAAITDINPTAAQAEAGNYRKGRVRLNGFDIAIENPKGSTRRGTAPDGTAWESQMAHHYGDIKGTEAADGDNLDVFIGDSLEASNAYVIDQVNDDGAFDEHKVMLGFDSLEQAREGYLANYAEGWQGIGEISETSSEALKSWVKEGDARQPFAMPQAKQAAPEEARSASGDAVRVPTERIQVDPKTYQFRSNVGEKGTDARLEGIREWDDYRAGSLLLHERTDGTLYAADGHHRIDLARKLKQPSVNAQILREADGVSVQDARRTAALNNIANDNATAIDAAKVFRETEGSTDDVIQEFNLPRREMVRDGANIARLSDDAFGAVVNQQVSEKDGASIGRAFSEPDQQLAAIGVFQRVAPQNENQRALLVNEIRQAGFAEAQSEQGGLFSSDPAESLIAERVKVMDRMRQQLVRDKRLFATLNRNAPVAEQAGNRINAERNEELKDASVAAIDLLERAATSPGVNAEINQAAQRVRDGEPVNQVATELKERLLNGQQGNDASPSQPTDGRTTDQRGRQPGESEQGAAPNIARRESAPEPESLGQGGQSQEVSLKADGTPFQTEHAARLSQRFRNTPNATPVEVDGGWGWMTSAPISQVGQQPGQVDTPLLETQTEQSLAAREQAVQQAEQELADKRREEESRAQADSELDGFGLTGSDRAADIASAQGQNPLFAFSGERAETADPNALPLNGAPRVRNVAQRLAEHPVLSGVRAIQSVTELPVHVLDTMEARGIDASKVAGVYDPTSGESFVVADNLMDTEEGIRRAVHEAVGHQGIHGVLGADVEKVMLQVYQSYRRSTSGNDALREIRHAYPYLNPETDAGKIGIAEELVARSIERSDNRPALRQRVMAALRNGLRALFPDVAWTDADIQALGERSRRYMQSRQTRQWRNPGDSAAALGLRSVVRADGAEAGVPLAEAQQAVDTFVARYQGNIPLRVRVAATQEELYGPQATTANVGRLKGGYHPAKGIMTIVAGNARGVRDIHRTLRHEILGHYGLNTFSAREKRVLLDRILETQNSASMSAAWESVQRNYPDAPPDVQAEEVFAYAAEAERGVLGQAWDRVLSGLQRSLRVVGLSRTPLRMAELHDLARRIGDGIREGRRSQQIFPATDQEQFSREAPVDEPSIRFSLKDKQPDSVAGPYGPNDSTGFALPDESWLNATLRIWADKMRPLKRLRRAIQQEGGTIEEEADPYLAEELYHGRMENDLETFRREHVEPLAKGLAKANISQADLDNYVYALHAPERNSVVAERNPNDPSLQDGGSGMSNAEAAEIIEKAVRSGKQAAYDRLAKIVHGITAVRRDAIRDGGLETGDVMDAWESAYEYYVPLKGFANDEPEAPRIGKGFQITGKESFMVKGRRDRAASPTTQAIVDANMAMIRRRKNEVGNAFLSMVTDHPNPGLWEVFTDESPDTERSTVRVTDPETGKKRWEVRERPVQMGRDDRYFKTKRAGLTYYIKVKDQRLMNAMRNVGPEKLNWLTRTAGAATRIMSAMMTSYSPEFLVTNFERDIQTALLNIGAEQTRDDGRIKGQRILVDSARDVRPAMRAAWRGLNRSKASNKAETREWDRWFQEFIEDGAKTGYFDMKDIDAQAKEISSMVRRADGSTMSHMLKARKKTADFVENINGAVENAVRLSTYVNSRRNGLTRRQAASLAKNLTVNFNRRGEIGTGLNAAYMFANASIQGTMNFARVMVTLKNTPEGKSPMNVWSRFNLGQKIGFGMASAAFALGTLNRLLSDEDDDGELFWDKVPDHVKERHYVLMTGWMTGNPEDYVKIPLPYGYNVFAVAGTHLEAVMSGTETPVEAAKNLGLAVAGSFSPIGFEDSESLGGLAAKNLTPTLARSLVQLGWNEDFAARMIYRENDSYGIPSPESTLYMRSTPEAYKDISRVLNDITDGTQNISGGVDINPDVIQHLVNYYGGGAWSFVEKTADFAARSVSGQEVENYRTPFVGKVLGTVTPYQDQSLFYQRRNELGQVFKEAESLEGREGVDYRSDNRARIRLYLDAVDITSNLRDLRGERDVIEVSNDLDDAMKRERIEEVEKRMKFQVDRFNRQYNALE